MARKDPEELSVKEIRYLLVEKRRTWRRFRLENFHRTGRVASLVNEFELADIAGEKIVTGISKTRTQKGFHRTWLDKILLAVELLVIAGLVTVVLNAFSSLTELNLSAVASLQQPTFAPTPIIREVVLPDGHTPPNSPGGARPNEAEIPEHLRPVWQSLSKLPTPIPAVEQAIRIQIPAIGVDAPVVQGDGWEQLKKGVAQHIGTPDPGENGNIVLSGHNDVFGEVFRYLDRLSPGDIIVLFTTQRQYTYVVIGTQMVEPTAVEVMAATSDARVTLISCHPYLVDMHRIVVSAVLQSY